MRHRVSHGERGIRGMGADCPLACQRHNASHKRAVLATLLMSITKRNRTSPRRTRPYASFICWIGITITADSARCATREERIVRE